MPQFDVINFELTPSMGKEAVDSKNNSDISSLDLQKQLSSGGHGLN